MASTSSWRPSVPIRGETGVDRMAMSFLNVRIVIKLEYPQGAAAGSGGRYHITGPTGCVDKIFQAGLRLADFRGECSPPHRLRNADDHPCGAAFAQTKQTKASKIVFLHPVPALFKKLQSRLFLGTNAWVHVFLVGGFAELTGDGELIKVIAVNLVPSRRGLCLERGKALPDRVVEQLRSSGRLASSTITPRLLATGRRAHMAWIRPAEDFDGNKDRAPGGRRGSSSPPSKFPRGGFLFEHAAGSVGQRHLPHTSFYAFRPISKSTIAAVRADVDRLLSTAASDGSSASPSADPQDSPMFSSTSKMKRAPAESSIAENYLELIKLCKDADKMRKEARKLADFAPTGAGAETRGCFSFSDVKTVVRETTIVLTYIASGTGFYVLTEGWTAIDALFFSVTTLSTVGYGNIVPSSDGGRIFAIFYVLGGVGIVLLRIGRVTHALFNVLEAAVVWQFRAFRFVFRRRQVRRGDSNDGLHQPSSPRAAWNLKPAWQHYFENTAGSLLIGLTLTIVAPAMVYRALDPRLDMSDAFWHCCTTATTVGYGDVDLSTQAARLFASFGTNATLARRRNTLAPAAFMPFLAHSMLGFRQHDPHRLFRLVTSVTLLMASGWSDVCHAWTFTVHIMVAVSWLANLLDHLNYAHGQRKFDLKHNEALEWQLSETLVESLDRNGDNAVERHEFIISMLMGLGAEIQGQKLDWERHIAPLSARFDALDCRKQGKLTRDDIRFMIAEARKERSTTMTDDEGYGEDSPHEQKKKKKLTKLSLSSGQDQAVDRRSAAMLESSAPLPRRSAPLPKRMTSESTL